jgi:sugar/nucleoside kinase (ribokinase family)
VQVINTIGAGDAFDAGMIAALVEGKSLRESLAWGNAVAALKIGREGGAQELPNRGEVERLVASGDF